MKKRLFLAGALALFAILTATTEKSFAAGMYGCATQYGGECPSQELRLSKSVRDPKTREFVSTLENTDNKYSPSQTVDFKITVTNIGNDTIDKVTVQDNFPEFLSFVSGPGKFDNNTKTLTFDVTNLKPSEVRETIVTAKIATEDKLPSDQGITCVVNHAQVTLNGKLGTADSQLCIQKAVLPAQTKGGLKVFPTPKATTTPPTGPEALALIGLLPGASLGAFLRKKASLAK